MSRYEHRTMQTLMKRIWLDNAPALRQVQTQILREREILLGEE